MSTIREQLDQGNKGVLVGLPPGRGKSIIALQVNLRVRPPCREAGVSVFHRVSNTTDDGGFYEQVR
jgi:hypothetical protein